MTVGEHRNHKALEMHDGSLNQGFRKTLPRPHSGSLAAYFRGPRRRHFLACLALLAIAPGFLVDLSPSRVITRSNFSRIRHGMSVAEVETMLGKPGDHFTRHTSDYDKSRGWEGP
jgi:hypothetical protein